MHALNRTMLKIVYNKFLSKCINETWGEDLCYALNTVSVHWIVFYSKHYPLCNTYKFIWPSTIVKNS